MKKAILLICFSILAMPVFSQLRFGLKGGVSTTSVDVSPIRILEPGGAELLSINLKEAYYGVHAGIVLQFRSGKFLFQPEVLFNSNKVDYQVDELGPGGLLDPVVTEKYQFVDIPVLAGLRLGPLRLMAGPEAHFFVNSKSDFEAIQGYSQRFDTATFGWIGGLGLDIWNIMLDVRYEGNFSNLGSHFNFNGQQYEFSDAPSRWLFSLGILFGE